MMICLD